MCHVAAGALHDELELVGAKQRIIAKLGARNGTHAVALALRKGLLPLPRERELQFVPQRAQSARELRR